jgi:protein-S-isoprenylcysteine O-methyltransferase Ste14
VTPLARTAINLLISLLLLGLAWGSVPRFYADPVRTAAVLIMTVPALVLARRTAGRAAQGRTHVERAHVRRLGTILRTLGLLLIVFLSARGIGVLPGGETLRRSGLAVLLLGSALRAGAMASLGARHSLDVALVEGHRLLTSGLYSRIRHPSYAGWLLMVLGFSLVFRSAPGLVVVLLTLYVLARRIEAEESFLREHFGEAWRRYAATTRRLVPGVW